MFGTWLDTDWRNTVNATSGVCQDIFWPKALSLLTKTLQNVKPLILSCCIAHGYSRVQGKYHGFSFASQLQGCLTNTPKLCHGDHHQLLRQHASILPVPFIRQMFVCIQHCWIMLQAVHIPVVDNSTMNASFPLCNPPAEWILGYNVA